MQEKIFANVLNFVPEFGPKSLGKIKNYFGSFKKAWEAQPEGFKNVAGILRSGIESWKEIRKKTDPEKEFKILEKDGVKILLQEELPQSLKETPVPPELLYVKGELPSENLNFLGVVGTRKLTSYGREATRNIIEGLRNHNFIVISGLALGIDAIAHQAALQNNIKTAAVLGSGLSEEALYPRENKKLAEKILDQGGALMSEYPYSMKAQYSAFPQRNRIIAGLSRAVLVVEAPEKSGALGTANFALEYNREVLAVPGPIFQETSRGTNNLIKAGAVPVVSSLDILENFGLEYENSPALEKLQVSDLEKEILDRLIEPMSKDELVRKIGREAREVIPALVLLEMRGIIKDSGAEIFKIK